MDDVSSTKRSIAGPVFLTLLGFGVMGGLAALPVLAGPPPEAGLPDLAKFLGRFHPVVLHLPIGMLLLVLLLETGRLFQRKKSGNSTLVAMFFASASAVMAVVLGFLLYYSMPGDYDKELGDRHLYGGIIFACGTLAAFIVKVWVDVAGGRGAWIYWLLLVGSSGVMGFASHDGASLTHGKTYLTDYAPNPVRQALGLPVKEEKKGGKAEGGADSAAAAPAKAPGERVVYSELVVPIFEQKCYSCHNAEKQKGKYRMDEYDLLVKGGKEGDGIIHGKSADSNVIVRIDLPKDDDEHMPPEGKKDLEEHEVVLIKWWIDSGASKDAKVADLAMTDAVKEALGKVVPAEELEAQKAAAEQASQASAAAREAIQAEVEKLRKEFPAALNFESQVSSGVVFTAVSMRKDFGDEQLLKLAPVVSGLVSLDLSGTKISDASGDLLGRAVELRSLRISETAVTDAVLDSIGKLPKLESLNLYGTKVTNAGVMKLGKMASLKKLYLWQTQVDAGGVAELKKQLPDCEIDLGQ